MLQNCARSKVLIRHLPEHILHVIFQVPQCHRNTVSHPEFHPELHFRRTKNTGPAP
jgi:hypothetical protein